MATQTYMTAKLNLADGTIIYPQISLDNIVRSISDPTLVTVAELSGGKVPIAQLPTTLSVTDSNTTVPTAGAVYGALNTKQNTLVEGDNIIHIVNGSTIMADITNLDVAGIDQTATNGVHLVLDGNTVSAAADLAANNSPGVIAGATNGVQIDANGYVQGNFGAGMEVTGGTANVDIATVDEVLHGTAQSNMVDADGLTGALSLGQAVDVSSPPTYGGNYTAVVVDGSTSSSVVSTVQNNYLKPITLLDPAGNNIQHYLGWAASEWTKFPKGAKDLKYLMMADVRNAGGAANRIAILLGSGPWPTHAGVPSSGLAAGRTDWSRIWVVWTCPPDGILSGNLSWWPAVAGNACRLDVCNWREYEVTNLTDEAIEFLANYGKEVDATTGMPYGPDPLFRSSSYFAIKERYLVKADMVCPWTYTISMPDNSALTVAAGLSYKIKYTNNSPHPVTVDTIPTNAYGQDTHIQMFIKGTSGVQFQPPLILMDALTANAGNNLSIKYRNGQALVYVDDANAGYTVIYPTGSTSGTLEYGLTYTPDETDTGDKYIIFGSTVNGITCDAGTTTVNYDTNVLGNGVDQTLVTGVFGPKGATTNPTDPLKTLELQDLALTGTTITGAGAVVLDNVRFADDTLIAGTLNKITINSGEVDENATVVSQLTYDKLAVGDLVVNGTFQHTGALFSVQSGLNMNISGTGTISPVPTNPGSQITIERNSNTMTGVTLTGYHGGAVVLEAPYKLNTGITDDGIILRMTDVTITGNTGTQGALLIGRYNNYAPGASPVVIMKNCTVTDNSIQQYGVTPGSNYWCIVSLSTYADVTIDSCTFGTDQDIWGGCTFYTKGVSKVTLQGSNKLQCRISNSGHLDPANSYQVRGLRITIADDTTLDLTGNTNDIYMFALSIDSGNNVTVVKASGGTATMDSCSYKSMSTECKLVGNNNYIVLNAKPGVWTADNVVFGTPVDAYNVDTLKLSGNTFSDASTLGMPARIQLPVGADKANSFVGNTGTANTTLLRAVAIVAGDNADAPSGTAYVNVSAGVSSSYSGIGSYIKRDGSADFVALNTVGAVTAAAGSLSSFLGGSNKWGKVASGAVATAAYTATSAVITDKTLLDHNYDPILGGSYYVRQGGTMTVTEATRTVAITDDKMTMNGILLPAGATLQTSAGMLVPTNTYINGGGTLDLANTQMIINAGYTVGFTGCKITGGHSVNGGGAFAVSSGAVLNLTNVTLDGNTNETSGAGGAIVTDRATVTMTGCTVTNNRDNGYFAAYFGGGNTNLYNCYFSTSTNATGTETGYDICLIGTNTTISGCTFSMGAVWKGNTTFTGNNKFDYFSDNGTFDENNPTNIVIANDAVIDISGSTWTTPMACHFGITFAAGKARVYPPGAYSYYELGGMSVPALPNTNIINLNGGIAGTSNTSAYANACVITSGGGGSATTTYGGAFSLGSSHPGLRLDNVTMRNNSAAFGAAVYADGCPVTLYNTVVSSNAARTYGGGIAMARNTAVVNSCTFAYNTGSYGGAAYVQVYDGIALNMTNCTISSNSVSSAGGGGISVVSAGAVIANTTFTGNTAPTGANAEGAGGALYLARPGANTVVSNCTFTANTARAGGAMEIFDWGYEVEVQKCKFNNNTGVYGGAVVAHAGAKGRFTSCTFSGNTATTGNAMYLQGSGKATLVSCTFGTNDGITQTNDGIVVLSGTNTLAGITGGTTTITGGAIVTTVNAIEGVTVEVQTGGCTVNGHPIAANTYTKINPDGTTES